VSDKVLLFRFILTTIRNKKKKKKTKKTTSPPTPYYQKNHALDVCSAVGMYKKMLTTFKPLLSYSFHRLTATASDTNNKPNLSTTKKTFSYSPPQRSFLFTLGFHLETTSRQSDPVASEKLSFSLCFLGNEYTVK